MTAGEPTPSPGQLAGARGWPDQPRLARWAHWCTFLGFIVIGLSVVGILLAVAARRQGEFGAEKALRNAIAVTVFLAFFFLAVVAFASRV